MKKRPHVLVLPTFSKRTFAFCLSVLLLALSGVAYAEPIDLPPGWPWRAVSIGSLKSSPPTVKAIKAKLPINAIRLHLAPALLRTRMEKTSLDAAWEKSLLWMDSMVSASLDADLVCIVNLSDFSLDEHEGHQKSASFWEDAKNIDRMLAMIDELVGTVATNRPADPRIVFDFISEPVVRHKPKPARPPGWPSVLQKIIHTVRSHCPEAWMVVCPGPGGTPRAYEDFSFPKDVRKVIFGVHMYRPATFTFQGIKKRKVGTAYPGTIDGTRWDRNALESTFAPLVEAQKRYGVPVFVGEFSAVRWAKGAEDYLRDLAGIFTEHGWGWAYFSLDGWHGWNPDYNQHYPGKGNAGKWNEDYVGDGSERWKTLREIYGAGHGGGVKQRPRSHLDP